MASRSRADQAGRRVAPGAGGPLVQAAVYVAVPAVALLSRYLMRADIAVVPLIILCAALVVPAVRSRVTASRRIRVLHAVVFGITGALILGAILITPYRSFEQWFSLFGSGLGSETAAVSNLFVVVTTYFSALLLPAAISVGPMRAAAAMVMFLLFLAAVITQNIYICALFAVSLIALIALVTRSRWVLTAGAVAAVAAIALASAPTIGSRDYIDLTLSPTLRRAVLSFNPQFPLLYDISRAAADFREKKLGGVPVLTAKPIFELTGAPGQTIYIRTDILDQYTGSSWKISERVMRSGTRFRRGSSGWRDDVQRLKLKVLTGGMDLVPTTLDTVGVISNGTAHNVVEGNYDTGFRLSQPIAKNQDVTLIRVAEVAAFLRPELRRAYLQVPDELPYQVRELAGVLSQDANSSEQVLKNIQNYLARNYSYTLSSVSTGGKSSDFVASFLFHSSGGYCVNFASAFVILARLNGIPARYATGYLAHIPSDTNEALVTELTSHAWPEVWLDGRGWVTYEATPAVDPASYHQDAAGQWIYDYSIQEDSNTARQLAGILGHVVTPAPTQPAPGEAAPQGFPTLLVAAALAVLLLILGAGALLIVRRRRFTPAELFERRFYRRLRRTVLRLERKTGVPAPSTIGWLRWTELAGRHLNGQAGSMEHLTAMTVRHLYADQPLPDGALRTARRAHRSIRRVPGRGLRHGMRIRLQQMTRKR
ncbi:transglutaminase-like domain-containing protein [Salinispira pacifica]